jgi:hypothetical protein
MDPKKLDEFDESELSVQAEGKGKKLLGMEKRYRSRLSLVKQAKEAQVNGNLLGAVKKYHEYLKVLGDLHEVDPFRLRPSFFDKEKELPELFLISQVYWELARIYDLTPKLQPQFKDCLNQFVVFTNKFPFQIVNAEIARRFLKKGKVNNLAAYQEAYNVIYIANKSCFIATECFNGSHQVTQDLRLFRNWLAKFTLGRQLIDIYYRTSPKMISFFRFYSVPGVKNLILRPSLKLFSKMVIRFKLIK